MTRLKSCQSETPLLVKLINDLHPRLNFYAINVSNNKKEWSDFIDKYLKNSNVINLWDDDNEANIPLKYAVLSTPRIYVIDNKGYIVARGLDIESLTKFLMANEEICPYKYGSDASHKFYDNLFSIVSDSLDLNSVKLLSNKLKQDLVKTGCNPIFKHLSGDLLYYLNKRGGEVGHLATKYLVDSLIIPNKQEWNTPEDSLSVVGFAYFLKEIGSLSPIGTKPCRLTLPCKILKGDSWINKRLAIRNLKNTFVVFYSSECFTCIKTLEKIDSLSKKNNYRYTNNNNYGYVLVDLSILEKKHKCKFKKVIKNFDISVLPFIIYIDKNGVISRKYIDF